MKKSLFEQMGGTYTQQGDYVLPNLILPAENQPIGIWGQRHARYLKQHHRILYYNLLTSGKLNGYLANMNEQAEDMFLRLVKELAEKEGITERLKSENQILWVQRMNAVRETAIEMINHDLIITLMLMGLSVFITQPHSFLDSQAFSSSIPGPP